MQPLPFAMPPLREVVQFHSARANDAGIAWLVGELNGVAAEPMASRTV